MIGNLRTKSVKALPVLTINRLGQVNVFCGKNNSGKSTILEAITDADLCSIGVLLDNAVKKVFIDAFTGVTLRPNWNGSVPSGPSLLPTFASALEKTAASFGTIFQEDLETFLIRLGESFDITHGKHCFQIQEKQLRSKWEELFNFPKPLRVLIPPKRVVESSELNTNRKEVGSDGSWLLNELFYCKNQADISEKFKLYGKIKEIFEDVSAGFTFDLVQEVQKNKTPSEYEVALKFRSQDSSDWVNAEDCGLGLRELLIIIYFSLEPEFPVILIEEPENHIHPEMQRRLLRFLSEGTQKQYFISTHSNIFLNTTYVDRVFHISFAGGKINISDATTRTEILNELGYSVSDNLVSDLIILVEGPKDTPIIEEYLKKFGIDADYNIKTWALGGDIMGQVDLSVFAERYNVIALVDKDPKSEKVRKQFTKKCKELEIPVTRLKRYAIENYFSLRVLREVFGSQISKKIMELVDDKTLEAQIGINVKNNNRKLAQEMTIEEIEGTDLHSFFKKVEKICSEKLGFGQK